MKAFERVTCEEVQVGDRIARTRNDPAPRVTAIDEGPVSRRLHQEFVEGDTPAWLDADWVDPRTGERRGFKAGNIRPRRTAKLWRVKEER